MNILRFLASLSIFFIGCNQAAENTTENSLRKCTPMLWGSEDSTDTDIYKTGKGALLGTRITSFEELKTIIQIEYERPITADSTAPENRWVRVHHCSAGREVMSVLEKGTTEGDLYKAKDSILPRFRVLFDSPYAVMYRRDLNKIFMLSRIIPFSFGVNDVAFFDIAKAMVKNINTPDLAFKNTRDSTEKGYLNTFNHMTAQAIVTSCFSEELADFVADIHERDRHPELITGIFTPAQIADLENGPVDNYVDIVNNEWGQEIGKQLKVKYGINRATNWTPELLANYLNDMQTYYMWAFQIGFKPFRPEDKVVRVFAKKMKTVMTDDLGFD
ncbi:MAG: hypothetical protein JNL70_20360 [Saprospiraceae bacterium]|nr:hypothetical protein [Saprospiraceae bacterium]